MVVTDAPVGASFRVIRVKTGKEVGKRLADMGFTEGTEGAVVRGGFLHGPFQIRIRGYDILIRRSEASDIEVEPVGDWTAIADASRWMRRGFSHHGKFLHILWHLHGHGHGFGHGAYGHGCDDEERAGFQSRPYGGRGGAE
jgi:Fe2+ transport system protein FeoA